MRLCKFAKKIRVLKNIEQLFCGHIVSFIFLVEIINIDIGQK